MHHVSSQNEKYPTTQTHITTSPTPIPIPSLHFQYHYQSLSTLFLPHIHIHIQIQNNTELSSLQKNTTLVLKMETEQPLIKLPIGFRFHPTDQELLLHYLKRKLYSLPLPPTLIPDHVDVFHSNPWDLPGLNSSLTPNPYLCCLISTHSVFSFIKGT